MSDSDASMAAAPADNDQDANMNLGELQEHVQEVVKSWSTSRGVNVATTNYFKELVAKTGIECKKANKKCYLNRTLIKIWKGSVLKDIKKKRAFKQLVVHSMTAYEAGKFDIARSQ